MTERVQRRRGAALEAALLEASWAELVEHGYGGFVMDRVARRASTSRAVLYRRWDDKRALVMETLRHQRSLRGYEIPDTGSLRGDMLALLDRVSDFGFDLSRVLAIGMAAYVETGVPIATFREELVRHAGRTMSTVIDRAVARGEVDPADVTPLILNVPMDLVRHHVLMTGELPGRELREEIIDTIFLPLVSGAKAGS
jgi:AcrR family transcriptional regulator